MRNFSKLRHPIAKTASLVGVLFFALTFSQANDEQKEAAFFKDAEKKIQQALKRYKPRLKIKEISVTKGPFTLKWQARTHLLKISPQSEQGTLLDLADIRIGRVHEAFILKNLLVLKGTSALFVLDRNIPKIIIKENRQIGRDAKIVGDLLFYMGSWRKPVYQDIQTFPLSGFLGPAQDNPTDLQNPSKPYFRAKGNLLISQNHFRSDKVKVTAFDISTSKVVWENEFEDNYHFFEDKPGDAFEHEYNNRLHNATDVIIGDRYIFSTLDAARKRYHVRALDLTTGKVLWEKKFRREGEISILEIVGVENYLLLSGITWVRHRTPQGLHRVVLVLDSREGKRVGRLEHTWDYGWSVELVSFDKTNVYYLADSYQEQAKEFVAINWRSGKIAWKNRFNKADYLRELVAKHGSGRRPFKSFADYIPLQLKDPDGATYRSHLVLIHRANGVPHFILTLGRKTKGSDIGISPLVTSRHLYATSGGVLYAIEASQHNGNSAYAFAIDFSRDPTREEKRIQAMRDDKLVSAFYKTEDVDLRRIIEKEIISRDPKVIDLLIPRLHSDAKLFLTGTPGTERTRTLKLLAQMDNLRLIDVWRKEAAALTPVYQSQLEIDGTPYVLFGYEDRLLAQRILKKRYGVKIRTPAVELIGFKNQKDLISFLTKWAEAEKNQDFAEAYRKLKSLNPIPHPFEKIIQQLDRKNISKESLWKWEDKLNDILDPWDWIDNQVSRSYGVKDPSVKRPIDKLHFISKMSLTERKSAVAKLRKWWLAVKDGIAVKFK